MVAVSLHRDEDSGTFTVSSRRRREIFIEQSSSIGIVPYDLVAIAIPHLFHVPSLARKPSSSDIDRKNMNGPPPPYYPPQQRSGAAAPSRLMRPPFVDTQTNIMYDVNDSEYEGWLTKQSSWLKVGDID